MRLGAQHQALYYDIPTVLLAAISTGTGCGRTPRLRECNAQLGHIPAGVALGVTFHAVSSTLITRRAPRYRKCVPDPWLVPTAVAEEVIWRASVKHTENAALSLTNSVLFGTTHLHLGGWKAAAHMALFGIAAELCARAAGLPTAMAFHVAYNISQLSAQHVASTQSRRGQPLLGTHAPARQGRG
ncbi:type II CAAX prenyl endopeptidase Rce1 family protein [Actinomyces lilanjuaniae]